jgi:hypothetical protein
MLCNITDELLYSNNSQGLQYTYNSKDIYVFWDVTPASSKSTGVLVTSPHRRWQYSQSEL